MDRVALLAVSLGCRCDLLGNLQAALQSRDRALDHPVQYPRRFVARLLRHQRIDLGLGDLLVERQEHHTPPNPIVIAANIRLVIARDRQLELGCDLNKFLQRPADQDRLAAGQCFDDRLAHLLPLLGFGSAHHARAGDTNQIGRCFRAFALLRADRLSIGAVVAYDDFFLTEVNWRKFRHAAP